MMPIGSTFLLKYHVSFNFMLIITLQFHCDNLRKLWISFLTYLGQTKIWKFVRLCDLYNWMNQSSFEVTLLDNLLINGHYLKTTKLRFRWKLLYLRVWFLYDCHSQWISYSKKFILNCRTHSIFPAFDIKKLAIVGKIFWRFDIILHIWLTNLLFH